MAKRLYLTGMMGCGKSSLGKRLAKEYERPFYDLDALIEAKQNKSISSIFSEDGEALFRAYESLALKENLRRPEGIVSTGGGVILSDDNVALMRNNGTIILIDRPIDHIAADIQQENRPLLKQDSKDVFQIYESRIERYRNACDYIFNNNFPCVHSAYGALRKLLHQQDLL